MFPILILDDTQADLALAERVLRNCKILNPILAFQNGEDLLKYFTGDFDPPTLVFTDMVMQPMSGNDVLRAMQRRGLTDSIPFVMVSGLADYNTLHEGYQNGARTFIVKPLKQEDILQVLRAVKGLEVHSLEEGYVIARDMGSVDRKTLRFGS